MLINLFVKIQRQFFVENQAVKNPQNFVQFTKAKSNAFSLKHSPHGNCGFDEIVSFSSFFLMKSFSSVFPQQKVGILYNLLFSVILVLDSPSWLKAKHH